MVLYQRGRNCKQFPDNSKYAIAAILVEAIGYSYRSPNNRLYSYHHADKANG